MSTPTTSWGALRMAPWRFLFSPWPWRALGYSLVSAVLGFAVTLLATVTLPGIVTLPLWGILLSAIERRRTAWLGTPQQPSAHVRVPKGQRRFWLALRLGEAVTWRETGALLLSLVVHAVNIALLSALTAAMFLVIYMPVQAQLYIDKGWEPQQILLFEGASFTLEQPHYAAFGALFLVILALGAYLLTVLVSIQNSMQRLLYAPRAAELGRELRRLEISRETLVEAQRSERTRIERDLHDGVQQDLVVLATRLGLTEIELHELEAGGTDVSAARTALGQAQSAAETALASLRDAVRGLHPAVLTDAGIATALHELAGRAALPLRVDTSHFTLELGRLSNAADAALYYAVTEGVSNAAKYSGADEVEVVLSSDEHEVELLVVDRGVGGVGAGGGGGGASGTGLPGLRERAETLGGSLIVTSPPGEGTTLRMRLPLSAQAIVPKRKSEELHAHPFGG